MCKGPEAGVLLGRPVGMAKGWMWPEGTQAWVVTLLRVIVRNLAYAQVRWEASEVIDRTDKAAWRRGLGFVNTQPPSEPHLASCHLQYWATTGLPREATPTR